MEPVLIIGAGPSGLAAAACLKQAGVGFVLVDKNGRAGGAFCRMDRNLKLLSPNRYVSLPFLAYPGADEYPSMPDYEQYLAAYAQHFGLAPTPAEVTQVQRVSAGFAVKGTCGLDLQCRFLVVASGLFDHRYGLRSRA